MLSVDVDNKQAYKAYIAAGFKLIEQSPSGSIRMRLEAWVTLIILYIKPRVGLLLTGQVLIKRAI